LTIDDWSQGLASYLNKSKEFTTWSIKALRASFGFGGKEVTKKANQQSSIGIRQ
jgi:hypothetical protein